MSKSVCAALALCGVLFHGQALADDIWVTDLGDSGVKCTLREAIAKANNNSLSNEYSVIDDPQQSARIVRLPPGEFTLTGPLTETATVFGAGANASFISPSSGNAWDTAMLTLDLEDLAVYGRIRMEVPASTATLILRRVHVLVGATATEEGGCIHVGSAQGANIEITESSLEGCSSTQTGGAIYFIANSGTLVCTDSTFEGSTSAAQGASVVTTDSVAALFTRCTLRATGGLGPMIENQGGLELFRLVQSTLHSPSGCPATGSTNARVRGSIVDWQSGTCTTQFVSEGGNIFSRTYLQQTTTDLVADPLLDGFGDYGGPVPTYALAPESPAIDYTVNTACIDGDTDARGVARPQGHGCDVGAHEAIQTLVLRWFEESAGDNCEAGGLRVETGADDDGDGALDESERENTSFVCNGTDGAPGTDGSDGGDGSDGEDGHSGALLTTADEPPGENCANGGTSLSVGIDDDFDGTLSSTEIDQISYVCDGEDGADGRNAAGGCSTSAAGASWAWLAAALVTTRGRTHARRRSPTPLEPALPAPDRNGVAA